MAGGASTIESERGGRWNWPLGAALFLYTLLVVGKAIAMREQINPDAISYVRNAMLIVDGRYRDSVSGYWSPLLSWSLVPFVWLGMDGLHAARVALAIWGGVWLVAARALLRSVARPSVGIESAVLILLAVAGARAATMVITADLPMFALLLVYFSVATRPDLLARRRLQVACGVIGGLAYLAKSYALPFFLVHYPFSLVVTRMGAGRGLAMRRVVIAAGMGLAGLAVVAGPWVGLLSVKVGRPTFSTVARVAHTLVGPDDKPRGHPVGRLYHIPPGRVYHGETPEIRTYHPWSPFESGAYFRHQMRVVARNAGQIVGEVAAYDMLRLTWPILLLLPLLAFGPTRRARRWQSLWTLGTLAIYVSGFTLVYYERRYSEALLWPLCCIVGVASGGDVLRSLVRDVWRRPAWIAVAGTVVILGSFAGRVVERDVDYLRKPGRAQATHDYRRMAGALEAAGCRGPFAAMGAARNPTLFAAFHLGAPFSGSPESTEPAGIETELHRYDIATFLVPGGDPIAERFRRDTTWTERLSVRRGRQRFHVFTRRAAETGGRGGEAHGGGGGAPEGLLK